MLGFGLAVGLADRWRLPMLAVAVLMLVIGGAADMASAAFRVSMLQSAASDDVRGRLQGVFTVVVVGGPRIADVAHGAVAVSIGAAATAAGGGAPGDRRHRAGRGRLPRVHPLPRGRRERSAGPG